MINIFKSSSNLQKLYLVLFAGLVFVSLNFYRSHLGGHGLSLPFNAVAWIFASALIGIGLWQIGKSQQLIYNRTFLIIGLGVILLWIPMLYPNQEFGEFALGRLLGITAGWLIMMSFIQMRFKNDEWLNLLHILLTGALIYSVIALILFYGFLNDFVKLAGNTSAGIFAQRNVASTFIVLALSALFWLITITGGKDKIFLIYLFCLSLIFAWLLTINVSRSGHIGFLALLLLSFPWLFKKVNYKTLRIIYLGLIIGITTPHAINQTALWTGTKLDTAPIVRDSLPTSHRITMWKVSHELFSEKPVLGWGYGGFDTNYHITQADYSENIEKLEFVSNVSHPHNEIIFWAVEGGLIPIIVFLLLVVSVSKSLFNKDSQKGLFLLGILFTPVFHSMVEYPFYHANLIWVLFCIFLAYSLINTESFKTIDFPSKFATKLFALIIPLMVTVFMLLSIHSTRYLFLFEKSQLNDIQKLKSIINPISQYTRYSAYVNHVRLMAGIKLNKRELIESYVAWAQQTSKRISRKIVYYNHILALRALGRNKEAEDIYNKATRLFDNNDYFIGLFPEKISAPRSGTSESRL